MFDAGWAQEHVEEQIGLIKTLCAIPAFSGQEEQRAAYILDWLRDCGAQDAFIDQAGSVCLPFGDMEAEKLSMNSGPSMKLT